MAFKNLIRQKARTILTIIAIVVGSLSVVLMLSLVTGAKKALFSSMEEMGALSLITVTGDPNSAGGGGGLFDTSGGGDTSEGKKLDDETVNNFKKLNNVFDATPIASTWVKNMKLEGQDKKLRPSVIGYDPETTVFEITISTGRSLKKGDMDKMVVSADLLGDMGSKGKPEEIIGKKMLFIFEGTNYPDWGEDPPKPTQNMNEDWWEEQRKNSHEIKVEIVGVMESGPMSGGQNFVTLDFAEKLMTQKNWKYDESSKQESKDGGDYQQPALKLDKVNNIEKNGYSSIMIKADDTQFVQGIAEELKVQGYGVSTAQEMINEMTKAFTGIGIVLGAIGGVALFVAAIGIINTMVMATYERTKEIGVLRACGATRAAIRKLFILEAGMIGFWGGVFGLGFSYTIAQVGNLISNKYFSQYSIPIQNIASFPLWLIIGVLVFTTLLGILAGLYPAVKASRLDPVEALRYE